MKKTLLVIQLLLISTLLSAQLVNINPNHNDTPWWVFEVSPVTPEIQAEIDQVPNLVLSATSLQTNLPTVVDNSQEIFMRPVFSQQDGCCAQASGIGYTFTYEINRLRNLPSDITDNQYPTHFTYNIVKQYPYRSSYYLQGWKLLKYAGCPNVTEYGGEMYPPNSMPWRSRVWKSDYDLYKNAMQNRTSEWYLINATTSEGLDELKHWLNDHNEDSTSTGGLACFATYMNGETNWEQINDSIKIATELDTEFGYHAMTIVGYNDTIGWDFNSDGLLTDTVDLNGDNIINMHDWELGAVKIVNSWGTGWSGGFQGYSHIPYKFFADTTYTGYPSKVKTIMVVNAEDNEKDLLLLKTKVAHSDRGNLIFKTGYSKNADDVLPLTEDTIGIFDRHGGAWPMQTRFANDTTPLECALDFGQFYLNNDFGKIYLIIREYDYYDTCSGRVVSYSIVDYRWNEEFELECELTDVPIENHTNTYLSIDYDLIPHEEHITSNLNLFSNMVSRFTPTINNNSTLTVEDGVRIDLYDSEILISDGSTIVIEDNVTFIAKRGICKLIIDGNITIGSNVSFIAEDGAELEVLLNNKQLQTTFNHTTFNRCKLESYGIGLTISYSTFDNCYEAISHLGDVTITNTAFNRTQLHLGNHRDYIDFITMISNCSFSFSTNSTPTAIMIFNYKRFFIINNTINGYCNGIILLLSGEGASGNQTILENEIMNGTGAGILLYNTTASIVGNNIHNNYRGIVLYNNCNTNLAGNPGATTYAGEQQIMDNVDYEVYASTGSFPWYMRHNVIIDEGNNPDNPMVYYEPGQGQSISLDVRYNCWGNSFDPLEDLYPSEDYIFKPTWCPGGGSILKEAAESLYLSGKAQYDTANYTSAKSTFEMVVSQYPETKYASASLKDLFTVEKFVTNDYAALQQYYNTNSVIQTDMVLTKLSVFLANKCDVEIENWQPAINHYEDIINNPETPDDSIFAIIDLGHLYLLMDNSGGRSLAEGKLLEYIPNSKEEFFKKRDYLLSLLPFKKSNENNYEFNPSEGNILLQNYPNPLHSSTIIYYQLKEQGEGYVKVFNNVGEEIRKISFSKATGLHNIELDMSNQPAGIYYYSMVINGKRTDTKKMVVVK